MTTSRARAVAALRRAAVVASAAAQVAFAQAASLRGRVLTDSTELPIAGVVVAIEELKLSATTDSLGNFLLGNVKPGAHIISAKKIGFGALATRVRFSANDKLEADFLMLPMAQNLPEAKVEAKAKLPAKLVEFEERRLSGNGGRFLTQADLEKHALSTLADAIRVLPGLDLKRSGSEYYAAAGRSSMPACAFCGGVTGNPPPCFAAVVIDGAFVYGAGEADQRKFDLNSIDPSTIAGIEYYAGAASMPVKYNSTRSTCALLMIWTK